MASDLGANELGKSQESHERRTLLTIGVLIGSDVYVWKLKLGYATANKMQCSNFQLRAIARAPDATRTASQETNGRLGNDLFNYGVLVATTLRSFLGIQEQLTSSLNLSAASSSIPSGKVTLLKSYKEFIRILSVRPHDSVGREWLKAIQARDGDSSMEGASRPRDLNVVWNNSQRWQSHPFAFSSRPVHSSSSHLSST